ncbi:MAG: pyrroline-5-carboxylate reductase [Syntrophaceticus sp.]|nr:pyrroline-5-carboxylate reductase [Syntrophaceticus sp.]MDD3314170.1 pyrroline-5-carboxylate reductase [Syntrophaceticus sp.]MDD4359386.1 pyrroline-5-carboxylate reductase [Syntrophaceticus sp.]MDD4782474.1 pyrroline-5-carboxylate reductase [Syntrophaceticus sp.]
MSFSRKKVGVIGVGVMGSAITQGLLRAGLVQPKDITASDSNKDALQRLQEAVSVQVTSDNSVLVQRSEVVIIAVKPNQMEEILNEIAPSVTLKHLVVSIAAGIRISTLEKHLPAGVPVIRVMPNIPALIGEGMSTLALGTHAGIDEQDAAEVLFSALGKVITLRERELDAVTGISGCGPAYMAIIIEALADGGVKMGLSRQVALELAVQTMIGTARMIQVTGEHPAALKDRTCSPGGSTISGVHVLEKGCLRGLLMDAVETATERSEELQ